MNTELLELAEELAIKTPEKQATLKRSVSTAYYAVFHTICKTIANQIGPDTSGEYYKNVYRLLNHSDFSKLEKPNVPNNIKIIGSAIINLKEKRHVADYYPENYTFTKKDVIDIINSAKATIKEINDLTNEDKQIIVITLFVSGKPRP